MKTQGNDPSMPLDRESIKGAEDRYGYPQYLTGLTKREQFAAMALQGILSLDNWTGTSKKAANEKAEFAVLMADTLIEELNKNK